VDVHYLVEEKQEGKRAVRRLARFPSAVVYVLHVRRYSELPKHLNEDEFADVLEQILAVEKTGASVRTVKIRRGLFDVGAASPADFLKDRGQYYDSALGRPIFDKWPAEFRKPSGRLAATVVHTSIWRTAGKSEHLKTIEARQFFGYVFPVMDELLTGKQKAALADDLRRSNVTGGAAAVEVDDVKDFGHVTFHYLVKDGKALSRPTAMASRVLLSAKEIADDPLVVRKYLAPAGAAELMKQIREGGRAGQRLKSVEISRMHFDVVTRGEPGAEAARVEFKKNLPDYCRREALIRPETWPDRFRRPDGIFDVELTSTRIAWLVTKRE